ncbi:MAG: hypothetical protein IKH27_13965 [Oscillospiraceae bacterium]|nr:hypothetical protein [Oscillospiraceae bacterium]
MTGLRKFAAVSAGALAMMNVSAVMPAGVTVCAEESATSGTWGTNINWSYDTANRTLTISGRGAMNRAQGGVMDFP